MRFFTGLLVFLCCQYTLSVSAIASEMPAEQIDELLANVSRAMHETSYDMTLTYEYSGYLDSLKWRHRINDGLESSSIERLNGASFTRVHGLSPVECLSLGDRLMRGLTKPYGEAGSGFSQSYRFLRVGAERIAGRAVDVIQIVPLDQYRYGYNMAVDVDTGLLLRILTIGAENRVLERFQAVELSLGDALEPLSVVESAPLDNTNRSSACNNLYANNLPLATDADPAWKINWLPSGFVSSGAHHQTPVGGMTVFTDGLSVVTVFVREGQLLAADNGRAQRGATNVYLEQVVLQGKPFLVTVVGEIPIKTAARITASLELLR